ncbi:60S ribosomal protein [Venturia inaequalis]|nr:60S ribosomal protein [Venturia inaequalis]
MATDYAKMTVVQLKKLATERNISAALKSGLRKSQIIEKIEEVDAQMPAQEQDAPEPAPGTGDEVVEAPAVVNDEDMDEVSAVEGHPDSEPIASPHHHPIQPVEQDSPAEPAVEATNIPEPTTEDIPIPDAEEPKSSLVSAAEAEAPIPTAEVPEPLIAAVPAAQPSSDLTTPVPAEEVIEDSRKRKRRSLTPPVKAEEVAAKRLKQVAVQDTDTAVSDAPPQVVDSIQVEKEAVGESEQNVTEEEAAVAPSPKILTGPNDEEKWSRDGLFSKHDPSEVAIEPEDDDQVTEPAMHHATAALYIRGLQRPVQFALLEQRLITLASPPSAAGDDDSKVIQTLHLDQVKTHALVLFSSLSAASRVRSSLHGRNWFPEDKWRLPVWVDFIPEEKVTEWSATEEKNNEGRTGGRRWEVAYIENQDGVIEAVHREENSNTSLAPRQPSGQGKSLKELTGPPPNAPLGPRSSQVQTRPPNFPAPTPGVIPPSQAATFKTLDELFRFTVTSKPKIYWQPVPKELVEKRQQEMKEQGSRDWYPEKMLSTDNGKEYRYTFEGGAKLVHSGPHFTSPRVREREEMLRKGIVPPARSEGRGGGGGGRGGGRFGGGRGEWNGYRGGENNYRPGADDSYRPGPSGDSGYRGRR